MGVCKFRTLELNNNPEEGESSRDSQVLCFYPVDETVYKEVIEKSGKFESFIFRGAIDKAVDSLKYMYVDQQDKKKCCAGTNGWFYRPLF